VVVFVIKQGATLCPKQSSLALCSNTFLKRERRRRKDEHIIKEKKKKKLFWLVENLHRIGLQN
jgi:hypothetical protein